MPTVAAVAEFLHGLAPPWLSARFTDRAYGESADARATSLRWAERLDPLSVDPLLTEAVLATSPHDIPPLERAVARQPGVERIYSSHTSWCGYEPGGAGTRARSWMPATSPAPLGPRPPGD